MCQGLSPASQGQNLAVTVLYVPYSLDSGWGAAPAAASQKGNSRLKTNFIAEMRSELVFKVHRLLYHSTLGSRVIKIMKKKGSAST